MKRGRYPVSPKDQRTLDGIVFDSKAEKNRYAELKLMERAGEITQLELQPVFQTFIAGKPFCRVKFDFSYWRDHGTRRLIEDVKSTGTQKDQAYRLRKKAAELQYGISVVEIVRK